MKTAIHPAYEKTTIKCVCGNVIETRSTVSPEMHVELCSACHPFYTGKQKFVDTAGRVDKFRARLEKAGDKKAGVKKDEAADTKKSNVEKLAEFKKELSDTPKVADKPMTVTQESSSDVEMAAEEELAASKDNK